MAIGLEHILLWIVLYVIAAQTLRYLDVLPESISITGPILTTHSRHGLKIVEYLSNRFSRFWNYWGFLGVGMACLGILIGLVMFFPSAIFILLDGGQSTTVIDNPKNYLVIPGVNDFLPLSAVFELLLALTIGMVVHEGGHAIMCRIADIDIDSTGVALFALIPLGAFVEPDSESQAKAKPKDRLKMFAGGIMNNLAISLLAFILLVGPLLTFVVPVPGAAVNGVFPNSPADEASISQGDVITQIEGQQITDDSQAQAILGNSTESNISVTLQDGSESTVSRYVFITSSPESSDLTAGDRITHINNNSIRTKVAFKSAIENTTENVTLTLENGTTTQIVPGALISPTSNFETADQIESQTAIITEINGKRIYSGEQLIEMLQQKDSKENVTYTVYSDGNFETYTTQLSDEGKLGVQVFTGVSGLELSDFGVDYYPKEQVLSMLSDGSLIQNLMSILFLPFWSLLGNSFNFSGFIPEIANFYTVTVVPSLFEGLWLFIASLSFWTVWLNINLAFFNCLPTYPLDGGHITRESLKIISNKFGINEQITEVVTYTILSLMFLVIALVFLAPVLF